MERLVHPRPWSGDPGVPAPCSTKTFPEESRGRGPSWTAAREGSAASTWTTANPGGRSIAGPHGRPHRHRRQLQRGSGSPETRVDHARVESPIATAVTLQFDQNFRWYSQGQNEVADVDVRSSRTGGCGSTCCANRGRRARTPITRRSTSRRVRPGRRTCRFDFTTTTEWAISGGRSTMSRSSSRRLRAARKTSAPPHRASPRPVADADRSEPAMTGSRADASGAHDRLDVGRGHMHLARPPRPSTATWRSVASADGLRRVRAISGRPGALSWSGVPAGRSRGSSSSEMMTRVHRGELGNPRRRSAARRKCPLRRCAG